MQRRCTGDTEGSRRDTRAATRGVVGVCVFEDAAVFDQPLNSWRTVVVTVVVTTMREAFHKAKAIDQDIDRLALTRLF